MTNNCPQGPVYAVVDDLWSLFWLAVRWGMAALVVITLGAVLVTWPVWTLLAVSVVVLYGWWVGRVSGPLRMPFAPARQRREARRNATKHR